MPDPRELLREAANEGIREVELRRAAGESDASLEKRFQDWADRTRQAAEDSPTEDNIRNAAKADAAYRYVKIQDPEGAVGKSWIKSIKEGKLYPGITSEIGKLARNFLGASAAVEKGVRVGMGAFGEVGKLANASHEVVEGTEEYQFAKNLADQGKIPKESLADYAAVLGMVHAERVTSIGTSNMLGAKAYQQWAEKYKIAPELGLQLDTSGNTAANSASLEPKDMPNHAKDAAVVAMAGTGLKDAHPVKGVPQSAGLGVASVDRGRGGHAIT